MSFNLKSKCVSEIETKPELCRESGVQASLDCNHPGQGARGMLKKLQAARPGPGMSWCPCSKWLKDGGWIFHRALPPAVGSPFPHLSLLTKPPGRKICKIMVASRNSGSFSAYVSAPCPESTTEQRLPPNVRKK